MQRQPEFEDSVKKKFCGPKVQYGRTANPYAWPFSGVTGQPSRFCCFSYEISTYCKGLKKKKKKKKNNNNNKQRPVPLENKKNPRKKKK